MFETTNQINSTKRLSHSHETPCIGAEMHLNTNMPAIPNMRGGS